LKEKWLYITVTLGPFESKARYLHTATGFKGGAFESKVSYLYITVALSPLESKVLYTLQLLLWSL